MFYLNFTLENSSICLQMTIAKNIKFQTRLYWLFVIKDSKKSNIKTNLNLGYFLLIWKDLISLELIENIIIHFWLKNKVRTKTVFSTW